VCYMAKKGKFYIHIVKYTLHMDNRLKEFRARLDLTQEDLAERVGVTRQTINAIEKERYNPSLELAFKLANIFGINIEELFIYEVDKK